MFAALPLESEYTDDEGVRFTLEVQPPSSRAVPIAGSYHCSWKPRNNHFQNHADFKPKGLQSQFLLLIFLISTDTTIDEYASKQFQPGICSSCRFRICGSCTLSEYFPSS